MSDLLKGLAWEKRESSSRARGDRRVSWIVHGKTLSVEFWIQVTPGRVNHGAEHYKGEPCWPGGFEVHARSADREYDIADHEYCRVLGAPCWHDGSSLSASGFFATWTQSDEEALLECASWVRQREELSGGAE